MSTKNITIDLNETGLVAYCVILKLIGIEFMSNIPTLPFSPTQITLPLTESQLIHGIYQLDTDDLIVWPDGKYLVKVYIQKGSAPDTATDTQAPSDILYIKDDTEVSIESIRNNISSLRVSMNALRDFITTNTPYVGHHSGNKIVTYSDGSEVIVR